MTGRSPVDTVRDAVAHARRAAPTAQALRSLHTVRGLRRRFGLAAALEHAAYRALNRVMFVEWMDIIALERERLRTLDPALTARLSARLAGLADLEAMTHDPKLGIGPGEIASFRAGDACLLSYVDGELAGYTWAHTRGRPELVPGFVISVPDDYLYNYAGLTLPAFRGLGLQPYRHRVLLESSLCEGKRGLLGFVLRTNFASRRGQGKSGYRTIGSIWLVGTRRRFVALLSSDVRRAGVRRL